jgi:gliding motility-associated-like protein
VNSPICTSENLSLFTPFVTNASYFWEGPNGFISSANDTTIADLELTDSGVYSIYLEVDGCYSDTVTAEIVVNETYDILLIDTICSNETFVFGPNALNESGTYIQNLQSVAGCDSTVQLDLTVNPSYSFTIDTSLCQGESITFEGLTMNESGTYPFNLFTTLGCDSLITFELIVYPIPDAPSVLSNSPLSCPGDIFEVSTSSVSDGFYQWEGPNDYVSNAPDFTLEADSEDMGIYNVSVMVNGCISPVTSIELNIINIYSFEEFDLPNVFTPNGNGSNEVFDLQAYFKTCETYEVLYFDRWGNVVYKHTEGETPFSGRSLDGSELMDGIYMYKIVLEKSEKQGYVHLIR